MKGGVTKRSQGLSERERRSSLGGTGAELSWDWVVGDFGGGKGALVQCSEGRVRMEGKKGLYREAWIDGLSMSVCTRTYMRTNAGSLCVCGGGGQRQRREGEKGYTITTMMSTMTTTSAMRRESGRRATRRVGRKGGSRWVCEGTMSILWYDSGVIWLTKRVSLLPQVGGERKCVWVGPEQPCYGD